MTEDRPTDNNRVKSEKVSKKKAQKQKSKGAKSRRAQIGILAAIALLLAPAIGQLSQSSFELILGKERDKSQTLGQTTSKVAIKRYNNRIDAYKDYLTASGNLFRAEAALSRLFYSQTVPFS